MNLMKQGASYKSRTDIRNIGFLCGGPPKSGTTLLQHCLDLHPELSCPPEVDLNFLRLSFGEVLKKFNERNEKISARTSNHLNLEMTQQLMDQVFANTLAVLSTREGIDPRNRGLSDNSIVDQLEFYTKRLRQTKIILIFRHPIKTAISSWKHNHRIAQKENNPQIIDQIMRFGRLDGWVVQTAIQFSRRANVALEVSEKNPSIRIMKYEDLVSKKRDQLIDLYNFLDVSFDEDLLSLIEAESDFKVMRGKSENPTFFDAGLTQDISVVAEATHQRVAQVCAEVFSRFGYE